MSMKKLTKQLFDSFIQFLRHFKKTILLILIVVAITLLLSAAISQWFSRTNHLYLPSLGNIRMYHVEAYGGDIQNITGEGRSIDWATVYPGISTSRSFYVISKSNVDSFLRFEFVNWTFLDSDENNVTEVIALDNMNVTCSLNGTDIASKEVVYVTLTLSAGSSSDFINYILDMEVQSFSFDIVISAREK